MAGVSGRVGEGSLTTQGQREAFLAIAERRRWDLAFLVLAWVHLGAFAACWVLTVFRNYHDSAGYLGIWVGELLAMAVVFRVCGGKRPPELVPGALERFVRRVWIAYFLLAFNLGSLNTLRGHALFEFFPAMASLGSFAFIVLTLVLHRDFFVAVVILFCSGLLMAAQLTHAYLIFALAWWLVLTGIGWRLRTLTRSSRSALASRRSEAIRHAETP